MKKLELALSAFSFILAATALVAVILGTKNDYIYWLVILSAVLIVVSRTVYKKIPHTQK